MCECCGDKEEHTAYTRVAIVIREKFIGPKIRGVEVQGQEHGSSQKRLSVGQKS